jgi:hypothetical protein
MNATQKGHFQPVTLPLPLYEFHFLERSFLYHCSICACARISSFCSDFLVAHFCCCSYRFGSKFRSNSRFLVSQRDKRGTSRFATLLPIGDFQSLKVSRVTLRHPPFAFSITNSISCATFSTVGSNPTLSAERITFRASSPAATLGERLSKC